MPAFTWDAKDERQYTAIVRSCTKRGRYGVKRCKTLAAATVNKTRRREGRTLEDLDFWSPAFAGLDAKLPGYRRRDFCLPGRTHSDSKYPVPDCKRARNALSRASAAYNEGYLTQSQYSRVRACANRAKRRLCK